MSIMTVSMMVDARTVSTKYKPKYKVNEIGNNFNEIGNNFNEIGNNADGNISSDAPSPSDDIGNKNHGTTTNPKTKLHRTRSGSARKKLTRKEMMSLKLKRSNTTVYGLVRQMMQDKFIYGPLVFIVLFNIGPNYDDSLNFYFVNKLGWSSEFLGKIQLIHHLAKIVGLSMWRYLFYDTPFKRLFVGTAVTAAVLYSTPIIITSGLYQQFGINPKFLALSGELLRDMTGWFLLMPVFNYSVRFFAPKGLEATTLAILATIPTVGRNFNKLIAFFFIEALGITSDNFDNLSLFIGISGASLLLPLLYMGDVPDEMPTKKAEPGSSIAYLYGRDVPDEMPTKKAEPGSSIYFSYCHWGDVPDEMPTEKAEPGSSINFY